MSSLSTEKDNSFKDRAISFVNLNSNRAAILHARKMRAEKSNLALLDETSDKDVMHCHPGKYEGDKIPYLL